MSKRRVGLWLCGAFGSVGSTAALGLSAMARGIQSPVGTVTGLPVFDGVDLDPTDTFTVGGHDIRKTDFLESAREQHDRSGLYHESILQACADDLKRWSAKVRPGTILQTGATITSLADLPEARVAKSALEAIKQIQGDLREFRDREKLDQLVVVNVASTEPPFEPPGECKTLDGLRKCLEKPSSGSLPASSIYAFAAIDLGLPYINFTPSLGASPTGFEELAKLKKVPIGGKDGKTGETLLKTVLAPLFALRNLRVMSWVGHNILGAGDGKVLADPHNKSSKVKTKDAVLDGILGYRPQTHVSIEYIESMEGWKTAWDHIHFEGFLGTRMSMQFTWQGCDSILAAPLVLDLARLTLLSQRRGEVGVMKHLACFFKSPAGVEEHDFLKQFAMLQEYVAGLKGTAP